MANQTQEIIRKPSSIVVVMVPFPLQSHLNQLLQLSQIISSRNIPVHFVGSTLHNAQVKSRAARLLESERIRFHDFPIPHFHSPPAHDTKNSHLVPSFQASINLREPVKALLASLSETTRRVVVVHDVLMSSVVQDADSLPNTEAYIFNPISAVSMSANLKDAKGSKARKHPDIPRYEVSLGAELQAFVEHQFQFAKSNKSGHLYNTSRLIESYFLDLLLEKEKETNANMKMWAIGPLETVTMFKEMSNSSSAHHRHACLEWLDQQKPNDVLYVSFGTAVFMEDEQIRELAIGLEQSEVSFLWVLRDADKGNIFDKDGVRRLQLPAGFEERVKGKGMVVREWAPQLEILGHSSTGGFMSHCGWNSCLESLTLGVPVAAWPLGGDQPANAALITQVLKAGIVTRSWTQEGDLVSSSVVREAVKRLMASEEGQEVRKRAVELGDELRRATAEGGVSRMEFESFISHISR